MKLFLHVRNISIKDNTTIVNGIIYTVKCWKPILYNEYGESYEISDVDIKNDILISEQVSDKLKESFTYGRYFINFIFKTNNFSDITKKTLSNKLENNDFKYKFVTEKYIKETNQRKSYVDSLDYSQIIKDKQRLFFLFLTATMDCYHYYLMRKILDCFGFKTSFTNNKDKIEVQRKELVSLLGGEYYNTFK